MGGATCAQFYLAPCPTPGYAGQRVPWGPSPPPHCPVIGFAQVIQSLLRVVAASLAALMISSMSSSPLLSAIFMLPCPKASAQRRVAPPGLSPGVTWSSLGSRHPEGCPRLGP
ncbi:hypothetical protein NDU88_008874 [Pleurodeles waltl]|uniref:Uncharacterized protein n=1 Tax=Pleurodeles waltl TaxID=8319 RepID=A0AAV7PQL0_PLEWA|nr:hypothetical protein NDU88_008874 [Pleurodeles waltl]